MGMRADDSANGYFPVACAAGEGISRQKTSGFHMTLEKSAHRPAALFARHDP